MDQAEKSNADGPMKVAFQGEIGANSHAAALAVFPDCTPVPCLSFNDAFEALRKGTADRAMIALENTLAGRVGDVHHLLPDSGLFIVGEYFALIHHQLVGLPEAKLSDITRIRSHPMALGQCRKIIDQLGAIAVTTADTAGAVREIAEMGDKAHGALGSALAADIHGMKILAENVEDAAHNTTRFIILSASEGPARVPEDGPIITSFVFEVRNIPAALYKALGGFATNGVNMTKLESYQIDGTFAATQFYADIEGHPDDPAVARAFEELGFYSKRLQILGVYLAHPDRARLNASA